MRALIHFLFAFCVSALSAQAVLGAGSLTVNLKEECVLRSSQILLRDVADLRGPDPEQLDRLARISLGQSPAFGVVATLSRHRIWELARLKGVLIPNAAFAGATIVQVKLESRKARPDEIAPVLKSFLVESTPWKESEIEIRSIGNLNEVELPYGNVTFHIPSKAKVSNYGKILLPVESVQAGEVLRTFWVTADIHVQATIIVAAKRIPFGKIVARDDVKNVAAEVSDPQWTYFRDPDAVLGKVTRRTLSPGDPLTREFLADPFLVRNGETVRLRLKTNGIALSTLVRAEQNGWLGQVIRVRNLDFSKTLKAQVTGPAEVRVQE